MIKRLAMALLAGVLTLSLFACGMPSAGPTGALPQRVGAQANSGATLLQAANVHGNLVINLPADINVGEQLVVLAGCNSYSGGSMTFAVPSGWATITGFSSSAMVFITRVADGTEGATLNIDAVSTGPTGIDYTAIAFRLKGVAGAQSGASVSTGATKTPDPLSLTSGFGAVAQMYAAIEQDVTTSTSTTARVASSGYSGMLQTDATLGQHLGLSIAFKNTTNATDDPGVVTLTNANTPAATRAFTASFKGTP